MWTSHDLPGVEACEASKNSYALGMGIFHGWLDREGLSTPSPAETAMYNPMGMLFAQGMLETAYLVEFLGGRLESVYTLPGAGDSYATCHGGRNFRLGRPIGGGLSYRQAMDEMMRGETVEGAELLFEIGPAIESLIDNGELPGSRLPLIRCLWRILAHNAPAEFPWNAFFVGIP